MVLIHKQKANLGFWTISGFTARLKMDEKSRIDGRKTWEERAERSDIYLQLSLNREGSLSGQKRRKENPLSI